MRKTGIIKVVSKTIIIDDFELDDLEKSWLPKVANTRLGAPEPSYNLKTILKMVNPEEGNLCRLATFSRPHLPFPKII